MNPREVLGGQIKRLRKQLGSVSRPLSFDDLAALLSERLGRKDPPLAGTTVLSWETAKKGAPDPWALVELARLAGVSVEDFVYPPDAETEDLRPRVARPIDPSIVRPAPRSGDDTRQAGEG